MLKCARAKTLLNRVLFINGQPGCGKTLFSSILPTIPNVELLNYCTEIENICALYYLKKITKDAAITFIKIYLDETIYNSSMSRKTNFRYQDLSSALRDPYWYRYFMRLFSKGDEYIPEYIQKNNSILHFATHNLLPYSKILFESLPNKIFFIEVTRHPLYMIKQQFINYETLRNSNRHFHLTLQSKNNNFIYWDKNYSSDYSNQKSIDLAIKHLTSQFNLQLNMIQKYSKIYKNNFIAIPFEKFVIHPYTYLKKIEKFIGNKFSRKLQKVLKREKIPRKKIANGIDLKIYRKYGWETGQSHMSEEMELDKRMDFVKNLNPKKINLKKLELSINKYNSFILNNKL